jgi:hypothetical protein
MLLWNLFDLRARAAEANQGVFQVRRAAMPR